MARSKLNKEIKDLANAVDIPLVNQMLDQTELKDFEMNKSTITNVAEWALNGDSNEQIRKKLDLTKAQWTILTNICPTLLLVMRHSRAMADVIVAGSLFQTAIGGQIITKEQPIKVKKYEDGRVVSEHIEIVKVREQLPPNPILLKFLAEHKLSEKFGETKSDNSNQYRNIIDNMTDEEKALLVAASKSGEIYGS